MEVQPGEMWVATATQGIVAVDAGSRQTRRIRNVPSLPATLSDNAVRGLFREFPETMKYLAACLIYKDGITALLALAGVFSAGVLGWQFTETVLYGIWASIFGVIGGLWLAGFLDRMVGPRRAIMIQLVLLCIAVVIALGTTKDSLLCGLIPAGQKIHSDRKSVV